MPAFEYQCRVTSFRMLTPTVFEIAFSPEVHQPSPQPLTQQTSQPKVIPPFSFEAGQFVSIVIPGAGPNGRDLRRAYSIASAPSVRPVELCIKLVDGGPGTQYLFRLREGDVFRGYAPYGDFIFEPKPNRHACFIATGTGIAPFRSMILCSSFQAQKPLSTTCLLGVRDENELLYGDEFESLKWVKWVTAVSRPISKDWAPQHGFRGRVTDYLREKGDDYPWLETEYYLCGAGAMIDEVKQLLASRGVNKESIHQEVYYKIPLK